MAWLVFERGVGSEVAVQVLNLAGQLVLEARLPIGAQRLLLDTGNWPRGMYLVRVHSAGANTTCTLKIVH